MKKRLLTRMDYFFSQKLMSETNTRVPEEEELITMNIDSFE